MRIGLPKTAELQVGPQTEKGTHMTARIIDGKAFAAVLLESVAESVSNLKQTQGITHGLAVVLVGEDPESQVYVRSKGKRTVEVGMHSYEYKLPADTLEAELLALIEQLPNRRKI